MNVTTTTVVMKTVVESVTNKDVRTNIFNTLYNWMVHSY